MGYNVIVTKSANGSTLLDGTDYYADYYGGTIFFTEDQKDTTFNISFFQYIGENVAEAIKNTNNSIIGTFYDNRGADITDNDLWAREVTTFDSVVNITHNWVSATDLKQGWNSEITTVSFNKALDTNKNKIANLEIDKIKDGSSMFENATNLNYFDGDLSNLVIGNKMFKGTSITAFTNEIPKLVLGNEMFKNSKLTVFDSSLSSLVSSDEMFTNTPNLVTFNTNLSSNFSAKGMFAKSALETYSGALPYLYDGTDMFSKSNLTHFKSSLSSLLDGTGMFEETSLTLSSLANIANTLPMINMKNEYIGDEESDSTKEEFAWENGGGFYYDSPVWDAANNDIGYETKRLIISPNTIGDIMITWKNYNLLSDEEKVIAVKEYFELMCLKGWTVITNINYPADENITEIFVYKKEVADSSLASHVDVSGNYWKLYSAPYVLKPKYGIIKNNWVSYTDLKTAENTLGLTPLA